jgi:hypothetical protein
VGAVGGSGSDCGDPCRAGELSNRSPPCPAPRRRDAAGEVEECDGWGLIGPVGVAEGNRLRRGWGRQFQTAAPGGERRAVSGAGSHCLLVERRFATAVFARGARRAREPGAGSREREEEQKRLRRWKQEPREKRGRIGHWSLVSGLSPDPVGVCASLRISAFSFQLSAFLPRILRSRLPRRLPAASPLGRPWRPCRQVAGAPVANGMRPGPSDLLPRHDRAMLAA